MGIAERRLRQKEEIRSNILSTAWKLVKEEGWQSLSIRKIADAIEYSVPVIYDHFENKEAILREFGKQGFDLLLKKLIAANEKHEKPEDQLKGMADAYWNFAFKNPEFYQLMFSLGMQGCEVEKCAPHAAVFRNLVMRPIEQILKRSRNNQSNSCLKYHTYWSILHGLISIKMVADTDDANQLNKLVLDDAIQGFIKNLEA